MREHFRLPGTAEADQVVRLFQAALRPGLGSLSALQSTVPRPVYRPGQGCLPPLFPTALSLAVPGSDGPSATPWARSPGQSILRPKWICRTSRRACTGAATIALQNGLSIRAMSGRSRRCGGSACFYLVCAEQLAGGEHDHLCCAEDPEAEVHIAAIDRELADIDAVLPHARGPDRRQVWDAPVPKPQGFPWAASAPARRRSVKSSGQKETSGSRGSSRRFASPTVSITVLRRTINAGCVSRARSSALGFSSASRWLFWSAA